MLFLQECCKRQSVTRKRPLLTLNARNRQSDAASCAASSRVWPARTLRVLVQHRRHHPAAAEVTQLLRADSSSMVHCLPRPRHVAPPPAPSTRARALAIGSLAGFSRNASTHRPRRWSTSRRSRIQPLRERRLMHLVVNARPGHSSESLPTPWLRRPPTAPGRRPYAPQAPPQQALLWLQGTPPLGRPLPSICADPQVRLQKVADQNQGG